MSKSEKNIIHLPHGSAYKMVDGRRVDVSAIFAQDTNSCCYLDCCNNKLHYYSKANHEQRSIDLDALYELLNPAAPDPTP